jgi:hypothetical protein
MNLIEGLNKRNYVKHKKSTPIEVKRNIKRNQSRSKSRRNYAIMGPNGAEEKVRVNRRK